VVYQRVEKSIAVTSSLKIGRTVPTRMADGIVTDKEVTMYKYVLEDGTYFLTDEETGAILSGMDEVSIAFEKGPEMWTLFKHGRKDLVQKWYSGIHIKLMQNDLKDMAENLIVISGKFPVDELNRCLDTTGYIKKMIEKLGLEV